MVRRTECDNNQRSRMHLLYDIDCVIDVGSDIRILTSTAENLDRQERKQRNWNRQTSNPRQAPFSLKKLPYRRCHYWIFLFYCSFLHSPYPSPLLFLFLLTKLIPSSLFFSSSPSLLSPGSRDYWLFHYYWWLWVFSERIRPHCHPFRSFLPLQIFLCPFLHL